MINKIKIKIKLNRDLNGFKAGTILELSCDKDGIPFNSFWRRRLFDSEIDNCIQVVNEKDNKSANDIKTITKNGEK